MPVAHLKIIVDLGDDFRSRIKDAMEDEIEIAAKKWNYHPTDGERADIFRHGYSQLKLRINSVSGGQWDLGQEITFSMPGPRTEIRVPSEEADRSRLKLVRSRDGWVVDQDESESAVALNEFPAAFTDCVESWARTAVFYSVGSYKN